jgi:hypothetical protein
MMSKYRRNRKKWVNAVVVNLSKCTKPDVNRDERTFLSLLYYCGHWCIELLPFSLSKKISKQIGRHTKEPIDNDFFSSWSSWTLPVINAWREKKEVISISSLTLTKHMLVSKDESLSPTYFRSPSYIQWSSVVITFCIKRGWVHSKKNGILQNLNRIFTSIHGKILFWFRKKRGLVPNYIWITEIKVSYQRFCTELLMNSWNQGSVLKVLH